MSEKTSTHHPEPLKPLQFGPPGHGIHTEEEYRVESFHVNVGAGDAAVHLVTSQPETNGGKRVIERAYLIDGGRASNDRILPELEETINIIEKNYLCPRIDPEDAFSHRVLKFNGFVVTHWDGDHYEGVMKFIRDEANRGAEKAYKGEKVLLPRAIYDLKQPGYPPQSWFIAPSWENDAYGWIKDVDMTTLSVYVDQDFWVGELLKLRVGAEELLGANFFYDGPDTSWKKKRNLMVSPNDMLNANPLVNPGKRDYAYYPGLYCIAVSDIFLGNFTGFNYTEKNKSSIVLIVIWAGGFISHYLGADIHDIREVEIAEWLQATPSTSMKLSHHGALTSNPDELFRTLDPYNIVVSAGKEYGHPRWEVLTKIDALHLLSARPPEYRPFVPCRCPAYLIRDALGFTTTEWWSTKSIKPPNKEEPKNGDMRKWLEVFQFQYKQRHQAAGNLGVIANSFFDEYMKWEMENWAGPPTPYPNDNLVCNKLCELITAMVHRISPLQIRPAGSTKFVYGLNGNIAPITLTSDSLEQIAAVQVTSAHPLSACNGLVTAQYFDRRPNRVFNVVYATQIIRDVVPHGAFRVANEGEQRPLKRFSDLGEDQPQLWDLTNGNRKFTQNPKASSKRSHQRNTSWVDVGLLESSGDDSWDELDDNFGTIKKRVATVKQDLPASIQRRYVPPHISQAADIYFLSQSLLQDGAVFPLSGQVVAVPPEHALAGFMETLHYEFFTLADTPSHDKSVSFAQDDEWLMWFRLFCTWDYEADPLLGFKFTVIGDWPVVAETEVEFSITMPFVDGKTLIMSTGSGAEGAFRKAGLKKEGVSKAALKNMLIKRRTMVFGFNPDLDHEKLILTLAEVAKLVCIDVKNHLALKAFGSIELTLDTTEESRNALWFRPGMDYLTNLRLQFIADESVIQSWLDNGGVLSNVVIKKLLVIARKKAQYDFGIKNDMIQLEGSLMFLCRFTVPGLSFDAVAHLTNTTVCWTLTMDKPTTETEMHAARTDGLAAILSWLGDVVGQKLDLQQVLDKSKDEGAIEGTSVYPRRVELALNLDEDGSIKSVQSAYVSLELCFRIGKEPTKQEPVLFLFTFGWTQELGVYLKGNLWCVPPPTPYTEYDGALPEYEPVLELIPIAIFDKENQLRTLDIRRLLAKSGSKLEIPQGIPSEIYEAEIELTMERIKFGGAIRCPAPDPDKADRSKPPPIALDNLVVDVGYTWAAKNPDDKGFELRLAVAILLRRNGIVDPNVDYDIQALDAAKLNGYIEYNKGKWLLNALVLDLNVAHLASFWHVDDRSDVMEFMGKISIERAELTYKYEGGAGSEFSFDGRLGFGEVLKLKLGYQSRSLDDWVFRASLEAKDKLGKACTIGSILESFMDKDKVLGVPAPILSAQLEGKMGEEPVRLLCTKHKGMKVFAILISVGSISFWFVQFRAKDGSLKRFIRAAVSKISVEVSLLNTTLDSPFERMFFMWVQDTTKDDKAAPGITRGEFEALKECLKENENIPEEDFLLFKSSKEVAAEKGAELDAKEVVISAGSHFVIVAKNASGKLGVILDHCFGKPKKQKGKLLQGSYRGSRAVVTSKKDATDSSGAEKGTKAPHKTALGPLSVDNIGLWYKEGYLGVTLDATFLMGPVGLALLGFRIGVPFDSKYNLSNPPPLDKITWGLDGVIVSLNRPPLTVAGGFMHDTSDPKINMYAGGLIISFKPWTFQAMGVYATVSEDDIKGSSAIELNPSNQLTLFEDGKDKPEAKFTFAFIFCKLNGPLFSVGFADFAGLVAGFGINSDMALPTAEQVFEFPFVKERDEKDSESPVDKMKQLMKGIWFWPAEGRFWAAAGVRITAFQMLAANIVLVVQFGSDLEIGLFGVATCDVPATDALVKFAHVELGIVCTLNVNLGVFKLEAQLSPRSYVLAPQCHVTGGLAMYAWFKGDAAQSIAAGDWVLTLGGFHQAFKAPPQYPRPPRLGISWSLGSSLSVTGEAYFAITPKVCMGGGRLHAALSLGTLYAWFDAFLDFLINFEPFHFQMQSRIAVGVRFTLDLWLVTIRINAEVGAMLDMSGPPFGGVVHVDFWVFAFDVKFGGTPSRQSYITLDRFWTVVLKSSGSSSMLSLPAAAPAPAPNKDGAILLTCESGLEPIMRKPKKKDDDKDDEEDDVWVVRGGTFSFLVTFQFAINKASVIEIRGDTDKKKKRADIAPAHQKVYARPMQLTSSLKSKATITVNAPKPDDSSMFRISEWTDMEWRITPVEKPVQTSVWGIYDTELDPSVKGNHASELLSPKDASIPLVMGLSIKPPCPDLAKDLVRKFNIVKDRIRPVIDDKDKAKYGTYFPSTAEKADDAWLPEGKSKGWGCVKTKWGEAGKLRGQKAVDMWAKRLGFDRTTEEMKKEKFKPLVGAPPGQLLLRFEQMVPACPLIAAGH